MSRTIRVRDEDADRVDTVCDLTGLSKAEASHYLFRVPHETDSQVEYYTQRALEQYLVALHPDVESRGDITEALLNETTIDSAETLINVSIQGAGGPDEAEAPEA
jgi:hypothetical protein